MSRESHNHSNNSQLCHAFIIKTVFIARPSRDAWTAMLRAYIRSGRELHCKPHPPERRIQLLQVNVRPQTEQQRLVPAFVQKS